jgi:hypothetical protein
MKSIRHSLALLSLLPALAAVAAEPPAEGKYELKNRSTFSVPISARPPFWPIGWVRRESSANTAAAEPARAISEKTFVVTSILVGNPSLAVINGRAYMEGELVRLPKAAGQVRVRVQRIADGTVQLQAPAQMITASLRRAELGPKKIEEELLNEDR